MELSESLKKRASVRSFKEDKVSGKIIKELVKAAGMAPSINNSQPWKFYAVVNKQKLDKMGEAVSAKINELLPPKDDRKYKSVKNSVEKFSTLFLNAPVLIAVASKPYKAHVDSILPQTGMTHEEFNVLRNYPNIQSIGAAVQNLLLTAVNYELGACWLSSMLVARKEIEKIIGIKKPFELTACIAVGYPKGKISPRRKKPLKEIYEYIR